MPRADGDTCPSCAALANLGPDSSPEQLAEAVKAVLQKEAHIREEDIELTPQTRVDERVEGAAPEYGATVMVRIHRPESMGQKAFTGNYSSRGSKALRDALDNSPVYTYRAMSYESSGVGPQERSYSGLLGMVLPRYSPFEQQNKRREAEGTRFFNEGEVRLNELGLGLRARARRAK